MSHNQKDEFNKINIGYVLDSLKENISEASPYINYIKKLFGSKSAPPATPPAPAPPTINEDEYIKRLDKILEDAQQELSVFIANLDRDNVSIVSRNMNQISFIPTRSISKKKKSSDLPPVKISDPNPDLSKKIPPSGVIHSISEGAGKLRTWRQLSSRLEEVMKLVSHNIETFLQSVAKDVGYTPTKNDFLGLIHEFGKFPGLTPKTKKRIKFRLRTFLNAYNQLSSWLSLFKRTEKHIEKNQKKSDLI